MSDSEEFNRAEMAEKSFSFLVDVQSVVEEYSQATFVK